MIRNHKRKTCLVVWLVIAQSLVAHAIVPGLMLRPVAVRAQSTKNDRGEAVLRHAAGASRAAVCRIKASRASDPSHLPGRRGRTDRCRAFLIAFKATPTKGPLDCLMFGLADCVRPLDSAASSPDAVRVGPPVAPPPVTCTSLTIELCRPRC